MHFRVRHQRSGDYTTGYLRTIDAGIRQKLHTAYQPNVDGGTEDVFDQDGRRLCTFSYLIDSRDGNDVYVTITDWQ
jgi:hypothetical protein